MALPTGILARGPWTADQVTARWTDDEWEAPPDLVRGADAAVAALAARGSPAHDGLAARLSAFEATHAGLELTMQPARWALRLIETGGEEAQPMTAMCVVRDGDGRWLAGRRAGWLATWPNRWALGAGGAVEVGEDPAETLGRELDEEWQLKPDVLSVEALVALPSGLISLVGLARVPGGSEPVPDAEHDEFAWWPSDVEAWPAEADERLRRLASFLAHRRRRLSAPRGGARRAASSSRGLPHDSIEHQRRRPLASRKSQPQSWPGQRRTRASRSGSRSRASASSATAKATRRGSPAGQSGRTAPSRARSDAAATAAAWWRASVARSSSAGGSPAAIALKAAWSAARNSTACGQLARARGTGGDADARAPAHEVVRAPEHLVLRRVARGGPVDRVGEVEA